MKDEKYIRIGFFENFRGEDSVLISVDIHGLLEIESIFLSLTKSKGEFDTEKLKYLDRDHSLKIKMCSGNTNKGLMRDNSDFRWELTSDKWNELREMTTALYKNGQVGHQYLDSNASSFDDLQVILSFNEYDIEFWEKFDR